MKINSKYVIVAWLIQSWLFASYAHSAENGLIGDWRLDEGEGTVVHDRSGNNNQGVIHDAVWTKGDSGPALSFDGKKGWVQVPNSDSLIPKNNQVSVLLWFSPGKAAAGIRHLLAKWGNYHVRFTSPEHLAFAIYEHGKECTCEATFKFIPGTWYYLAAIYDGQSFSIYIDGDLITSQSPCPPVQMDRDDKHDLHLGSASWGVAEFFDGQLNRIKIYNRALTQEEVLKAGGREITPKIIAILKQETSATKDGLKIVNMAVQGKTEKELSDCFRDLTQLQARYNKVEQALSHEQTLSAEQAASLCQENRLILKEVENLAYRFGLEILFLEDK
jgi:hypothetical protein